jgi:arylsulfatase A-like enzyme
MGRKILFVTTDQQRYDALGCNGGRIARTPVVDRLAAGGVRYTRAHCQSVVCMPARSTMLTGQYLRTHGVWMNGVPLPLDAPSVAEELRHRAGYRTALIGKAHFEPLLDFDLGFHENRRAVTGESGVHRGFEHLELATHSAAGPWHYCRWLEQKAPGARRSFYRNLDANLLVNAHGGGDTGAVQVWHNAVSRELYHTDWVAERAMAYLDSLPSEADWFLWMSFPDPHHPWDPPASELGRVPWRDLEPPESATGDAAQWRAILANKPRHWLEWYEGMRTTNYEAPPSWVPATLTRDQLREVQAMIHVENELIDEAVGRVLQRIEARGWSEQTDVLYTTDHGELQGDFGLLFKGPCHVDALLRLPLIWRPAPAAAVAPAVIDEPVGQVDFAPTFCAIAGIETPGWMQGRKLPCSSEEARAARRESVLTEWESEYHGSSLRLRTIYRDGYTCTAYEQGTLYAGTEGELYDHANDPHQWRNLWDDVSRRRLRDELVAELRASLPPDVAERRPVVASV